MSKVFDDINYSVKDSSFTLHHIEMYEKGYYAGYINAYLLDVSNNRDYEILYRIRDRLNSNTDFKLQSIDYGYEIKNNKEVFLETEKQITSVVKNIKIDFDLLDSIQKIS